MLTRKQIGDRLSDKGYSKFVVKKTGVIEVMEYYFYGMGRGEGFVKGVAECLPEYNFRYEDRWAAWPKSSYWVAVGTPK